MTIRTGSHYRGQATGERSYSRLTENVTVNAAEGVIEAAGFTSGSGPTHHVTNLAEDFRGNQGQVVPMMRREDTGWQNLAFRNYYRDLPPAQQEKMIALSFWLYRNNAMAKRIIGMLVDFIWGEGLTLNSKNEKLTDALKGYWTDPRNNWPMHGPRRLRDLLIYGEWLHRPTVYPKSGKVIMGTIQPDKIRYILPNDLNHEDLLTVIFKQVIVPASLVPQNLQNNIINGPKTGQLTAMPDSNASAQMVAVQDWPAEIIHPTYDEEGEPTGWAGDVFYFGMNRTTDTTRGVGELFPLIDYIDLYDDVLFNRAERIATSAAMWWDMQYTGLTEAQIRDKLKDEIQLPPKPGTVFAHNENVILQQQTPQMGADDHEKDVAVIRSHIISSAGFTGTMFDAPGDAGRAVGAEMAESVYKSMKSMQEGFNQILRTELDFAMWHLVKAGKLAQSDLDEGYVITFPQPSARDIARIAPAVARMSTALHQARVDDLISPEEARRVLVDVINKQGLTDRPIVVSDYTPKKVEPVVPGFGGGGAGAGGAVPPQGTGPTRPAAPKPSPAAKAPAKPATAPATRA